MNITELLQAKFPDADESLLTELVATLGETINTEKETYLSEQTAGLKSNRDALMTEKDALKQQLAAIAAEKEEMLLKSGNIEEIKAAMSASTTKQLAEKQAMIDSLINGSVKEKNDAMINDIAMQINKDYPASVRAVIRDYAKTEYIDGKYQQYLTNDDGTKFDGDAAAFVKAFSENPAYANIVARDVGGATITSTTIQPNTDKIANARNAGDLDAFLSESLK